MYRATIIDCNKDLSKKERIAMKDLTNAMKLDKVCEGGACTVKPVVWGILKVENDNAKNIEYNKFVIIDVDGIKYATSSESFINAFMNIAAEMEGEEFEVSCYKKASTNYADKYYLTCSIVL